MKPPIIIVERTLPPSPYFFANLKEAEISIEWQGVEEGEYTAYDSEGLVLDIVVVTRRYKWGRFTMTSNKAVEIREFQAVVYEPDKLRNIIAKYFASWPSGLSDEWLKSASLQNLIAKGMEVGN